MVLCQFRLVQLPLIKDLMKLIKQDKKSIKLVKMQSIQGYLPLLETESF